MLEGVWSYLAGRSPTQLLRDALDVFIVYYVVYRALLVLRGTRAMQVGVGLGMLFLLYVAAQLLQLVTVLTIMSALLSSIILVIVVVFQNDIRRGLQRMGSRAWFGGFARAQETKVIDEVVEAATELARHRIGAIITFEQDANLDEFVGVHKGHDLDAQVTRELLLALFIPEGMNKLHDGSVIIRNYRIAKAGVFFPMPEGRIVDESFGSRHRAALGITEETDAIVVVVSEERGSISFCFNGNIASNLDGPKLRTMLEAMFSPKVRKKPRSGPSKRLETPMPADATPRPSEEGRPAQNPAELETPAIPVRLSRIVEEPQSRRSRSPDSEPPPPLRRTGQDEASRPTRSSLETPVPTHGESRPMPRAESNEPPEVDDSAERKAPTERIDSQHGRSDS